MPDPLASPSAYQAFIYLLPERYESTSFTGTTPFRIPTIHLWPVPIPTTNMYRRISSATASPRQT